MREMTVVFREGLAKGLRETEKNPRDSQRLTYSAGAFPEDKVIHALEDLSLVQVDTVEITASFPYPQMFVLDYFVLVCTADSIYEYKNGSLTLKLAGITVGSTWTVADYGIYIVMTNGATLVVRDAELQEYSMYNGCDIPQCLCLCDVNGQLLIGAPNITIPAGFSA